MSTTDAFVKMAEDTQVFRPGELEILREVLTDCREKPDSGYRMLVRSVDGMPAGFAIFGRTPCTVAGWDLYWLVVDKQYQNKGIGRLLVAEVEKEIAAAGVKAGIRVETSGRSDYLAARTFYARVGYDQAGILSDFYAPDDDLVMFYKVVVPGGH
jgi:ribosomal protein S18 acetylase RimI-like enzyme